MIGNITEDGATGTSSNTLNLYFKHKFNEANLTEMRFNPLPEEELRKFDAILSSHSCSLSEIIIQKFAIPINKEKLECLKPKTWLNDEVLRLCSYVHYISSVYYHVLFFL